ncbi:hypothetical protein DT070_20880 [Polaromonas sp. SP1]|nr:hypothetical protein DT070_20880 [Polaromonas sp. SP1]QGJ20793.1 hypothetical protein F7R28_09695 [Polaromonas sp. Pch-P]
MAHEMPKKTNVREKLDGAIAQERQAQHDAREIYEALTAKMWAYQTGKGPAPTNEDFAQWSEAVEFHVKAKQLGIRVDGESAA